MGLQEIAGYLFVTLFLGVLLLTLGAIVRFSIISPLLTRGARSRLRRPDPTRVARQCGVAVPEGVAEFYRRSGMVERTEFELVDEAKDPPARWSIGAFVPLTVRDVREAQTVHGISDLPLADDLDKGVYYLDNNGRVLLNSPNLVAGPAVVAESIARFGEFAVCEGGE